MKAGRLLWPMLAVFSCAPLAREPRAPETGAPHVRIATFNILDDRATDPATLDAIGALDAEIVALQEITPESVPLLRARYSKRFPFMIFHPKDAAGIGFLSVHPLVERAFLPGPNGWHPALHVTADTLAGTLSILNVHLHAPEGKFVKSLLSIATTPTEHRDEIARFFSACAPSPDVVLGDFNEDTSGAAVRWLEARGFQNVLPLYRPGQFTWQGKSVGGLFQHTIDHVMLGPSLSPLDGAISGHGVSDHLPVTAHFEWSGHH
ncbi:MAG: endonuclease/exonuclease/phosphatase family protein [Polyangiales bacterium]